MARYSILRFFIVCLSFSTQSFSCAESLQTCLVNLCHQQPCYFQIDWVDNNDTFNQYVTHYRPMLSHKELTHVHHTELGVGDDADLIQVRLNLPWDNDQWPLLTFTKNGDPVEVMVYHT